MHHFLIQIRPQEGEIKWFSCEDKDVLLGWDLQKLNSIILSLLSGGHRVDVADVSFEP